MPRNATTGVYAAPASSWNPAVPGTVISETDWNALLDDIEGALSTADATTRAMWARAGQIQDGGLVWGGTATGTGDAITITLAPAITAYVAGQAFAFLASAANTVTAPTLVVNGLAAKTVLRVDGVALAANDINTGRLTAVVYDGTNFRLAASVPSQNSSPGDQIVSTTNLSGILTLAWGAGQNKYQQVNPTADAAKVLLPPLTGFPLDQGAYRVIRNQGAIPLAIRDSGDTQSVAWAMPGQSVMCTVYDQTGTPRWTVVGQSKDECQGIWSLPVGNNALNAATDIQGCHTVWLTSTRFVLLFPGAANSIWGAVGEITGGNIRLGESQINLGTAVQSGTNGATWVATPIGTTGDFLFTWCSSPGSDTLNSRVCSVNATTLAITANASTTLGGSGAASVQCLDVTALTSATFLCVFHGQYTSQRTRAVVISVSGTTTTINTPADVLVATPACVNVMAMSATVAVATLTNASTGFTSAVRITISGTTVTVGVVTTMNAVTNFTPCGLWFQSSTTVLAAYTRSINSQNRLCFRLLTDNATTTIQVGTEQDVAAVNGNGTFPAGAVIPFSTTSAIYMDFVAGMRHMAIKLNSAAGTVTVRGTGLMYMGAGGDGSGGGQTPRPRATYPINVAGRQGLGRIERFGTTYLANFELLYVSEAQL